MNERQILKRQRTTQMILQAAKELIHENGFNRLSLRAVAARSGFSPASLYEYFTGKDDIIDTLCEQIDQRWTEIIQLEDSLVEVTMKYVQFGLEEPDDFQLLYQRAMLPDQEEGIPEVFNQRAAELSANLTVSPHLAAQTMWSLGHGLVLLSLHRDLSVNDHRLMVEQTYKGLFQ